MGKLKNIITYSLGGFLAFIFKYNTAFAGTLDPKNSTMYGVNMPMPEYGIREPAVEPTFWEKALSVILSPVFITTFVVLALIIGTVVFIKRKRKNVKKDT